MSVNKVIVNGSPIVDLTDATATASNIEENYTAYKEISFEHIQRGCLFIKAHFIV